MKTPLLSLAVLLAWPAFLPAQSGLSLYDSVVQEAKAVSGQSLARPLAPDVWRETLPDRRRQWLEMLGLWPLPERTPMQATVTGTLERGDYVVEKIHFQSLPGAHVAGNLYRPAKIEGRLPAVLYLCGHTKGKVAPGYQAHPRWFAQHGYVALVLDPVQLGECQGFHHGTYREERWDWQSRGYTPAGTEVWNAMRALDYLESRPDVDSGRLGVTGLSGGGAMSWFLGAADERVKAVAPVCQSGNIAGMAADRATDGHCDCAFWVNYHRWCWSDVGALIAPRAFLIASGSEDVLWRPTGYRDVANRIRHQFTTLGVPEKFDLVEDLAPHGYTPKLRQAIFTFFNTHLKGDPTPVTDDVTDYVEPEENLLVFGGQLPRNDAMARIEEQLVRYAPVPSIPATESDWLAHRERTLARLRELTFRHVPADPTPRARESVYDGAVRDGDAYGTRQFDTVDGLTLSVKTRHPQTTPGRVPLVLFAMQPDGRSTFSGGGSSRPALPAGVASAAVEVRNTGTHSVGPGYLWTLRRVYPLLGQTLAERQTCDLLAATALLRRDPNTGPVTLYGRGDTAALAIYAAVLDPEVSELIVEAPPETHRDPLGTATFPGILQIGDLPQHLALLYPRPITFIGQMPPAYAWTKQVYEALGAGDKIRTIASAGEWRPGGS
ncbi:MAG: acetylxylan esterase [Verrucomicrobiales bacterium]|nr:acetylxylan esterase [Verrucomicrobiales bacterium]